MEVGGTHCLPSPIHADLRICGSEQVSLALSHRLKGFFCPIKQECTSSSGMRWSTRPRTSCQPRTHHHHVCVSSSRSGPWSRPVSPLPSFMDCAFFVAVMGCDMWHPTCTAHSRALSLPPSHPSPPTAPLLSVDTDWVERHTDSSMATLAEPNECRWEVAWREVG